MKKTVTLLLFALCMLNFQSCKEEEDILPQKVENNTKNKKSNTNLKASDHVKVWKGMWKDDLIVPACLPGHICFVLITSNPCLSNPSGGVSTVDGVVEKHYGDGRVESVEFNTFDYILEKDNPDLLGRVYID